MSRAWVIVQEFLQATLLIASADAPDGGRVACQSGGQITDTLSCDNAQHNPGTLYLEPSPAATVGNGLQERGIRCRESQQTGSSATHEDTPEENLPSA